MCALYLREDRVFDAPPPQQHRVELTHFDVERPELYNIFEVLQDYNMTRGIQHTADTCELKQPAELHLRFHQPSSPCAGQRRLLNDGNQGAGVRKLSVLRTLISACKPPALTFPRGIANAGRTGRCTEPNCWVNSRISTIITQLIAPAHHRIEFTHARLHAYIQPRTHMCARAPSESLDVPYAFAAIVRWRVAVRYSAQRSAVRSAA
jgi:hypothetical protein